MLVPMHTHAHTHAHLHTLANTPRQMHTPMHMNQCMVAANTYPSPTQGVFLHQEWPPKQTLTAPWRRPS